MRYLFLLFTFYSFHTLQSQSQVDCNLIINGQIVDIVNGEGLSFATVTIVDTNRGVVSDENGNFILEGLCPGEIHLQVRFTGYKTVVHHHDPHHSDPIIKLAPDNTSLKSVIVEGSRLKEIQSLSIQKKEIDKLSLMSSSLGEVSEQLTGVSLLKTGTNILKPIIHGLHSNRVLVINDGVRHAYQVWGQEHAPEIDPSHVNQIEIVKGAGTVKYGPEALGGVILYNSKRPEFDSEFSGSVGSSYQTNGRAISSQFNIDQGSHAFGWNAGAYGIYQGDLNAPDYNLSNTGKREYGANFNSLLHRRIFDVQLSGSYLSQELGILRGSIVGNLTDLQNAIDRSAPNPTFPETYKLQNPQQETEHGLAKTVFSIYLGDHVFNVQYAIQRNMRREFDVRRGELNDRPVIDLKLSSHSLETEWIQPEKGPWSGSSGIQFFTQNSVNQPGSNPANFVPDYEVLNLGVFTIQTLDLEEMTLELGARVDYQTLNVADTIREQTIYANEVTFSNATFTTGIRKRLNRSTTIFSNIGSAWRPPNVSELYSFGYHFSRLQFGLWRYELEPQISTPLDRVFDQTDREVPSEKSLKWVSGIDFKNDRITAELIAYVNQINNYIFLRPYGISTGIAGTFPFFIYDQTNALFLGSDLDIQFNHSQFWTSEVKISYVYASEVNSQQAFLEIPPLNINYALEYKQQRFGYGLSFDYFAQQWNAPPVINPIDFQNGDAEINRDQIFDFMAPPRDYILVNGKITYQVSKWNVQLKANNLLNSSYRAYTDRLRYFADAPGRNFSCTVEYLF